MHPDRNLTAELGSFDEPTARAVVSVLRDRGCPAWTGPAAGGVELVVEVAAGRRDEALAVLAANMEDVAALADPARRAASQEDTAGRHAPGPDHEPGGGPPIVLERLRRLGLGVALVLAPLLVVTLASPRLPLPYALAVFVAGLVLVTYWRRRSED